MKGFGVIEMFRCRFQCYSPAAQLAGGIIAVIVIGMYENP
jgi:hypothetical protein